MISMRVTPLAALSSPQGVFSLIEAIHDAILPASFKAGIIYEITLLKNDPIQNQ